MPEAVIVDALRTPIGRHSGVLAGVRPDDLAAYVLRASVERADLDPASVDDVYLGCANGAGEDNRNVARMAALLAGFPVEVPGVTVNRLRRWRRSRRPEEPQPVPSKAGAAPLASPVSPTPCLARPGGARASRREQTGRDPA